MFLIEKTDVADSH